jgi:hypothetical protein
MDPTVIGSGDGGTKIIIKKYKIKKGSNLSSRLIGESLVN